MGIQGRLLLVGFGGGISGFNLALSDGTGGWLTAILGIVGAGMILVGATAETRS